MPKIIIASGPVIVEDGKVLLNKHGDTPFWKFCGGRVEDDDANLIENARREAKEEVGIDFEVLDDMPFITFTRKETSEGVIDIILVHFLAKRIGEIAPGSDIREWAWHPLNDLPPDLGPNIIPALKHFNFL
jgi:8-oxo-dGTP pyrophosphatase MutT (NUDIX family)